jgi:hypothetical protein
MAAMSLIGPAGMPAASSASSHSAVLAGAQMFAEQLRQRRAVGHARRVVDEARVGDQLRRADELGDALPVGLVGAANRDPAVGRRESLVGRGHHMRRTTRAGGLAGGEEDRRLPRRLVDAGLEQRGVDELALAGLQPVHIGADDAQGGQDAGVQVGHRAAHLHRRPPGLAGDAHQAADTLGDEIEAALVGRRAGAAVARDRAVDQRRVDGLQLGHTQAQAVERAAAVVLGQHVGGFDQTLEHAPPAFGLQVQRDAALVAVHHHEGRRFAVDAGLGIAPRVVAAGHFLDLDDVGAEVGEQGAAARDRP